MSRTASQVAEIFRSFRQNWPRFLLIHVVVGLLVFVVLAPASSLLLHLVVALSGDAALSDQDILFFLLSPTGFISLLVAASVFSIIIFLEFAALLTAAGLAKNGQPVPVQDLLMVLARRSVALFVLALLVLVRVLLNLLPFLLVVGLVYLLLLSDYDINYYLSVRPPEWQLALLLAGLIATAAGVRLLRLSIDWVFCLSLLLFANCGPREAMRRSREMVRGHRLQIGAWLLAWLALALLMTAVAAVLVNSLAYLLVPWLEGSVNALLIALGFLSLLGFLLSFAITFVETSWLGLLIVSLYSSLVPSTPLIAAASAGQSRSHLKMPLRYLVLALLAGLLVSVSAVFLLTDSLVLTDGTKIMAHRGASAAAPENTLAAIRRAIESGADWVEIDVQESADGQIVVIHDSDLKKIGGVAMEVAKYPAAELRQVDIGSWFGPEFSDQRIPLLSEVLALCRGRIGINIELKYYGHERRLEQRVAELVEAAGMQDQIIVMSLDYAGIKKMRKLRPDWTLGLLSSVALGNLAELDVDFLALNGRAANRSTISSAHKRGKKIMVWTVNDTVGISTMMSRGVDAIITDEPALAVSIREQHRQLEPIQLLLIKLADVLEQPALYREQ